MSLTGLFAQLASIGIHLRHRISSHGFSFNVTPEPCRWFDLVLACGLDDVKAVSLVDILCKQGSQEAASKLSVKKTALDLMPLFAQRFGKEFVELDAITSSSSADGDGARVISDLIQQAEQEAEMQIGNNGWRREPDLKGRSDLPSI
jgi:lipoyl(octanoyl) transferase